jgi:hypothetical protein
MVRPVVNGARRRPTLPAVRSRSPKRGRLAYAHAFAWTAAWWQRDLGRDRRSHHRAVGAVPGRTGCKVSRRPLDEVPAELEAQDEAAREADKAARKAIREQKKQQRKEDFQKRVDALKEKVHTD